MRRFVGDRIVFEVNDVAGRSPGKGWRALLRTNLGRGETLRAEIIESHAKGMPFAGRSWRDIPMESTPSGWRLDLTLAEPGFFKAKAYLLDPKGWQHWPDGPDFGLAVHPDHSRTANTVYCAFPRMFGETRTTEKLEPSADVAIEVLDGCGYAVIPPSGKLRDLAAQIPHIFGRLGCRVLHLLPVNPVPTTYARFGRYGSPYAALDLAGVDPALVVFDRHSTGAEQFQELTSAAHLHGGRVFLDIVANHTGWGSNLQENHPEWFLRAGSGEFKSPGAWGVTWEDLVELKHTTVGLWDNLSEVFLTWCRRGVDGFRCDAGYMVPVPAWQYIIARVQQEFPDIVFFLEGLGGAWEATEALLTEGGMQWAYSELFQNYSGPEVARYLDHSISKSRDVGLLVHYSETHDNDRLAARGRQWSLLRNRLCALTSDNGGFGFTCGVEWLATEKIKVHGRPPMRWGAPDNIIDELSRLNGLLLNHPCFFDGAVVERLTEPDSQVVALLRTSAESRDSVIVLVNADLFNERTFTPEPSHQEKITRLFGPEGLEGCSELLGQPKPRISHGERVVITLAPGTAYCLGFAPGDFAGEAYRRARARAAWAIRALNSLLPVEKIPLADWRELSKMVDKDPAGFLGAVSQLEAGMLELAERAAQIPIPTGYLPVVEWGLADVNRVTLVPPGHWVLICDSKPFRLCLDSGSGRKANLESVQVTAGHVAAIPPGWPAGDSMLRLERFDTERRQAAATLRFIPEEFSSELTVAKPRQNDLLLLTNGRGGMARIPLDPGRVISKYDCVLGANLHPEFPVDRHVFVKRIRVWVNADGFLSPLDAQQLRLFEPGPPARWHFVANAGDGRTAEIEMSAAMLQGQNTTVFRLSRPAVTDARGKQLPPKCDVRLTVRFDIEDRGFHTETHRNGGADLHFGSNTRPLPGSDWREDGRAFCGFEFVPAAERSLRVYSDKGLYYSQEEWSQCIPHPVEQSRGQIDHGDAFSPGWFEIPLAKGESAILIVTAESQKPTTSELESAWHPNQPANHARSSREDGFSRVLMQAAEAFITKRGSGKSVIAGYPWFLDWGRDTFIAARGLISAGWHSEVSQIVRTFARFEEDGTLPNTIFGEDASNRDTSDAPLWFAVVCEELMESAPEGIESRFLSEAVDESGRTMRDVLESIADHYISGTPNGILMDAATGLIWSPSHFTWMDTNYPAGTPREGYPIEIQALWIRMLRFLARVGARGRRSKWEVLARQACDSVEKHFWLPEKNYYSDLLGCGRGVPAMQAVKDDALRSNACFLASLGISAGDRARSTVAAAARHLLVPGALRSLAPMAVCVPLPVCDGSGRLLNDPHTPYWGRYEGDEDTRRKPAYHNGTAWVWTLPVFCEALARAWDFAPGAVSAARAYLGSTERLLCENCIGHLPEIVDGDAPHTQRGCDAQAWSVTETLRVWLLLGGK